MEKFDAENGGRVYSHIKPSNAHLDYQSYDKSQAMLYAETNGPNAPVLKHFPQIQNMPVECDNSDVNASLQTEHSTADGFTMEYGVPLYIWNNRNFLKTIKLAYNKMVFSVGTHHLMT